MEATPEPPPLSAARQQRRIERARLHGQQQADEAMAAEATDVEATAVEATAAAATVGAATATTAAAVSSGDMVCVECKRQGFSNLRPKWCPREMRGKCCRASGGGCGRGAHQVGG